MHLSAHFVDVPAGQLGHVARFVLLPLAQLTPVRGGRAAVARLGGMMKDVARLELALIARLLKDEILGEVRAVVADVHPREENAVVRPDPEHAELFQLLG